MEKYKMIFGGLGLLLISACATTDDLKRTEMAFAQKTVTMEQQAATTDKKVSDLGADLKALRENVSTIRKNAADEGANLTDVRERSAAISGRLDVLEKKAAASEMELADINARLSRLEKYMDPGKEKGTPSTPSSGDIPQNSQEAYAAAMKLFEKERYAEAKAAFENVLRRYPQSEESGLSQYGLAEILFRQERYEQAVLEYDKYVKNYNEGKNTPYALLKEGLCFIKLNDDTTAKLIFEQVVQKYPSSGAAEVARIKLTEMK